MCDKCVELDDKIEHYRRLSFRMTDQQTIDQSTGRENGETKGHASSRAERVRKPRKASAGQKEMLLPIEGKKPAKKAAKPERTTGRRKAG
jgi:hypothetical protein